MNTITPFDLIPIICICALAVVFFLKRRSLKKEEKELQETLQSLESGIHQEE